MINICPKDNCRNCTGKIDTATAVQAMKQAKYTVKMNYEMAKALVEGKVSSQVLRYAEMVYQSGKGIFDETSI